MNKRKREVKKLAREIEDQTTSRDASGTTYYQTHLFPLITFLLDEDNIDTLTVEDIPPPTKKSRPMDTNLFTSEEENESNIACLPPGIEEQYGFKINPVRQIRMYCIILW